MQKKIVWEWEVIDEWTKRAKVIGGWLVHMTLQDKNKLSCCSEFISDRDHEWIIIPPFKENPADIQKDKSADFEPK